MTGNRSNDLMRKGGIAVALLLVFYVCIFWVETGWDAYKVRILNLSAIYIGITLGLNLCNGFAGPVFSRDCRVHGCRCIYHSVTDGMAPQTKSAVFFIDPLIWPLNSIQWGFLPALIMAGLVSGVSRICSRGPCHTFP